MNPRLKFVLITVATVVAVAVTARLGFWQLSRAAEKQARQAAMDIQSAKSPLDAAAVRGAADPMSLLHQRARLRGTWAQASQVFLENRPMDGRVGFLVIAPFVLEGGGALVVQRGWVPRGFEDRTLLPHIATPGGMVEIEGRMALPPSDLYALGRPTGGTIRQNLDLPQFRAETGLPLDAHHPAANRRQPAKVWCATGPSSIWESKRITAMPSSGSVWPACWSCCICGFRLFDVLLTDPRTQLPMSSAPSTDDQPLGLTVHTLPVPGQRPRETVQPDALRALENAGGAAGMRGAGGCAPT